MMPKDEFAEAFVELMTKFDENRARWIVQNGTDEGFNEWFTSQVRGGNLDALGCRLPENGGGCLLPSVPCREGAYRPPEGDGQRGRGG